MLPESSVKQANNLICLTESEIEDYTTSISIEPLADGWAEFLSPEGWLYYFHSETEAVQWEIPTAGSNVAFASLIPVVDSGSILSLTPEPSRHTAPDALVVVATLCTKGAMRTVTVESGIPTNYRVNANDFRQGVRSLYSISQSSPSSLNRHRVQMLERPEEVVTLKTVAIVDACSASYNANTDWTLHRAPMPFIHTMTSINQHGQIKDASSLSFPVRSKKSVTGLDSNRNRCDLSLASLSDLSDENLGAKTTGIDFTDPILTVVGQDNSVLKAQNDLLNFSLSRQETSSGSPSPTPPSSSGKHLQIWNRFFINAMKSESPNERESLSGHFGSSSRGNDKPRRRSEGANAARTIWPKKPSRRRLSAMLTTCLSSDFRLDDEELSKLLQAAVLRCDLLVMEDLLLRGADPNSQTADFPASRSYAHFAARCGYETARDPTQQNNDKNQAVQCLALLAEYGTDLDSIDAAGCSPLHVAAGYGLYPALEFLLQSAVRTDITDSRGHTALGLAMTNGHQDCCALLLTFSRSLPSPTVATADVDNPYDRMDNRDVPPTGRRGQRRSHLIERKALTTSLISTTTPAPYVPQDSESRDTRRAVRRVGFYNDFSGGSSDGNGQHSSNVRGYGGTSSSKHRDRAGSADQGVVTARKEGERSKSKASRGRLEREPQAGPSARTAAYQANNSSRSSREIAGDDPNRSYEACSAPSALYGVNRTEIEKAGLARNDFSRSSPSGILGHSPRGISTLDYGPEIPAYNSQPVSGAVQNVPEERVLSRHFYEAGNTEGYGAMGDGQADRFSAGVASPRGHMAPVQNQMKEQRSTSYPSTKVSANILGFEELREQHEKQDEEQDEEDEKEEDTDAMSEAVWGLATSLIGFAHSMFFSSSSSSSASRDRDECLNDRQYSASKNKKVWWGRKGSALSNDKALAHEQTGTETPWGEALMPPTDCELKSKGFGFHFSSTPPLLVAQDILAATPRMGTVNSNSNPLSPPSDVSYAVAISRQQQSSSGQRHIRPNSTEEDVASVTRTSRLSTSTPSPHPSNQIRSNGGPGPVEGLGGEPPSGPNKYSIGAMPPGVSWRYVDVLQNRSSAVD